VAAAVTTVVAAFVRCVNGRGVARGWTAEKKEAPSDKGTQLDWKQMRQKIREPLVGL